MNSTICNNYGAITHVVFIKAASKYLIKKHGTYKAQQIMIGRHISKLNNNQCGL